MFLESIFQSTLPVWGATASTVDTYIDRLISIHAPRVGSDTIRLHGRKITKKISIHAPRVGSDLYILA